MGIAEVVRLAELQLFTEVDVIPNAGVAIVVRTIYKVTNFFNFPVRSGFEWGVVDGLQSVLAIESTELDVLVTTGQAHTDDEDQRLDVSLVAFEGHK